MWSSVSFGSFDEREQWFQAEDLHRTLSGNTEYLDLMWRSKANEAKFHNTREWVEIIAEETAIKLAAVKKVLSSPGSIPRHRQTETHGQWTFKSPGSIPRQRQTETHGHQTFGNLTTDTVKRTIIYYNRYSHKYANKHHHFLATAGQLYPTNHTRNPTPHNDQTACNRIDWRPQKDTRTASGGNQSIPRLMGIHIPLATPHLPVTYNKQRYKNRPGMAQPRKKSLQHMTETPPTAKRRRLNGRTRGGKKDKVSTPYQVSTPVKTEPTSTSVTDTKVKPKMDAMVLDGMCRASEARSYKWL